MGDLEFNDKIQELTSEEIDLDLGIVELIKRINNIIESLEKRKSEYEEELKNEKSEYIIKELKNDSKKLNNEIELHNNEIMFLNDYKQKYKKYDELLNKENYNKSLKDKIYNKLLNDKEQCEGALKNEKSNYIINELKNDLVKIDIEIDKIKKDIEKIGKILSKLNKDKDKDKDEFKIICDKYKFKITDYKKSIINSNTENIDNDATYQNRSNLEEPLVEETTEEEKPVEEKPVEEKPEEEKPEEEKPVEEKPEEEKPVEEKPVEEKPEKEKPEKEKPEEEKPEEEKPEEEKPEEEKPVEEKPEEEKPEEEKPEEEPLVEETTVTKNKSNILVLKYDGPTKNLLVLNGSDLLLSLNLKDLEWSKNSEGTIKLDENEISKFIKEQLIYKLDAKYIGFKLDDSNLVKNSNLFADIQDYLNSQNKSGNVNGSKTSKASDPTINSYSKSLSENIKKLNEYIEDDKKSYDDIEKLYRELLLIDKDKFSDEHKKVLDKAQRCLTQDIKILNTDIQIKNREDNIQNVSVTFTCKDNFSNKRSINLNLKVKKDIQIINVLAEKDNINKLAKCYFDLSRAVKNSECGFDVLMDKKEKLEEAISNCNIICNENGLINETKINEPFKNKELNKIKLHTGTYNNEVDVTISYSDSCTYDGTRQDKRKYEVNTLNVREIKKEIKENYLLNKDYSEKEIKNVLNAINPLICEILSDNGYKSKDYVSSVKSYVLNKDGELPFNIIQDLTKVGGKFGRIFNKSAKAIYGMKGADVKCKYNFLEKIKNYFKRHNMPALDASENETTKNKRYAYVKSFPKNTPKGNTERVNSKNDNSKNYDSEKDNSR